MKHGELMRKSGTGRRVSIATRVGSGGRGGRGPVRGIFVLAALLALAASTGRAVTPEASVTPYQNIMDRNVFGLKSPPPPPNPEDIKPPPSKIILTGITTILGNKRALMKTSATPGKPGGKPGAPAAAEQSYILTIGQREGDIEVLDIDEVKGIVKINNAGTIETLDFVNNGPKLPSTPPPPVTAPGVPPPTGVMPPQVRPATMPGVPQNPASNPSFQMPTRNLRTGTTPGASTPSTRFGGFNQSAGFGLPRSTTVGGVSGSLNTTAGGIPLNALTRAPGTLPKQQNWPPEDFSVTPEQQMAIDLIKQEQHKNDPNWPSTPGLPSGL